MSTRECITCRFRLVALLATLAACGCFWCPSDLGLADKWQHKGVAFNAKGLAESADYNELYQHVVALEWIGTRDCVKPLLDFIDRVESGDLDDHIDETGRDLLKRWTEGSLVELTGLWTHGTAAQWRSTLTDPTATPEVFYASYPDPEILRSSGAWGISNYRLKVPQAVALPLWREWWFGGSSEPWWSWFPRRMWEAKYPSYAPYIWRGEIYQFYLNRNAQLCGVNVKRWYLLSDAEQGKRVREALAARGVEYRTWLRLMQQERSNSSEEIERALKEMNRIIELAPVRAAEESR